MSGRSGPPDTREAGESLIEILLSIMILGIAVSALLFGIGTAAATSGLHSRQSQQSETLHNYVAALQAAPYVSCAVSYTPAATVPAGYTASIGTITYASGTTFSSTCGVDEGVQRMTVTVDAGEARIRTESVVVVKRKPCPVPTC